MDYSPKTSAPVGPRACVPDAPRRDTSLVQVTNELNELLLRGENEIHAIQGLIDHLRATIKGNFPTEAEPGRDPSHTPLGDTPIALAVQMEKREKLMALLAALLGPR